MIGVRSAVDEAKMKKKKPGFSEALMTIFIADEGIARLHRAALW